jgi:transposase
MERQRYTSEKKVSILREHFEKNIPVADICEKYRIHPNQIYKWKKALFEGAVETFSLKKNPRKERDRLDKLEVRLKDRNEVIAELLEENLKLKKEHGEI